MRDKGTGSVSRDSNGTWRATIEAGWTERGTRRRIKIRAATKTEAQQKLKEKLRQISEQGRPGPGQASMTVKRFAEMWIEVRSRELRPKTQLRNVSALNRWIVPTIGRTRLSELTPTDSRAVTKAMIEAGLSSSSAHRVHAVLTKMLRDAIVDGYTVPPRMLLVAPPPVATPDRRGPTAEESIAIMRASAGEPDRSRWVAALVQGMRQGECLGLTWAAIDLDRESVDVSWQLQNMPYRHGCGETCRYQRPGSCPERQYDIPVNYETRSIDGAWCLVRPKTSHGQRVIPLVPWMVQALSEWQEQAPHSPAGLVWPRPDGRPRRPAEDLAAWKNLQARADVQHPSGRPYVVHEARHAAATMLMAARVPESVRIAILGHSTAAVTRAYEYADLDLAREALTASAATLQLEILG